jgi:CobQ/CobB/MinD/ParA nucleotide binding domain
MKIVNVLGAKGGVGTSTTAAMIAVSLGTTGSHVVVVDRTGTGDVSATVSDGLLTLRTDMPSEREAEHIDYVIVDHPANATEPHVSGTNLLVTTNCYLAVRRSLHTTFAIHGLVVMHQPARTLDINDMHAVLAIPAERMLKIIHDPYVSKLIDAGLVGTIPNRVVKRREVRRFIEHVVGYALTSQGT